MAAPAHTEDKVQRTPSYELVNNILNFSASPKSPHAKYQHAGPRELSSSLDIPTANTTQLTSAAAASPELSTSSQSPSFSVSFSHSTSPMLQPLSSHHHGDDEHKHEHHHHLHLHHQQTLHHSHPKNDILSTLHSINEHMAQRPESPDPIRLHPLPQQQQQLNSPNNASSINAKTVLPKTHAGQGTNRSNIWWRPISPFSISDAFESTDNASSAHSQSTRAYLYSFHVEPDPYCARFAILTPKRISASLELPFIRFKIHFPNHSQCKIRTKRDAHHGNVCMIHSQRTSSEVRMDAGDSDHHQSVFHANEWHWILEFNQVVFARILYPHLTRNWRYHMHESAMNCFQLRNYLIVPLSRSSKNIIDWSRMEEVVKHYYCKVHTSYGLGQFLVDLNIGSTADGDDANDSDSENGIITAAAMAVNDEEEEDDACTTTCQLQQMVFCENGRYFVPLTASKQSMLFYVQQCVDELREAAQEQHDLDEFDALLNDDGMETKKLPPQDEKEPGDHNEKLMAKIRHNFDLHHQQLQLAAWRFDKVEQFIGNVTDSHSLVYGADNHRWVVEPVLDVVDLNHEGVHKLPFDANFFYALLTVPFMLYQVERILRMLQFIQSPPRHVRYRPRQPQKQLHRHQKHQKHDDANVVILSAYARDDSKSDETEAQTIHSFLMRIPLFTLSKILFQQRINIRHWALCKQSGQQLLTLLFTTASFMTLLSCGPSSTGTTVQITQRIMNESVSIFRKTLDGTHMMDYFAPSQFRSTCWTPPRFDQMDACVGDETVDSKRMANKYYAQIAQSAIGRTVNAYIAKLLRKSDGAQSQSRSQSDECLFAIMTDIFSIFWYFNYAKPNLFEWSKLCTDCASIAKWMRIDDVLNISSQQITAVCAELDAATKHANLSNDYSMYHFIADRTSDTSTAAPSLSISLLSPRKRIRAQHAHKMRRTQTEQRQLQKRDTDERKQQMGHKRTRSKSDPVLPTMTTTTTATSMEDAKNDDNDSEVQLNDDTFSIAWCNREIAALNTELQSLLVRFVRHIEYDFEYPPIAVTALDPFQTLPETQTTTQHALYDRLNYTLLYDLGNVVLNAVATISVASHCFQTPSSVSTPPRRHPHNTQQRVRFYQKCFSSQTYLSYKCRTQRLHKHLISHSKHVHSEFTAEVMASFVLALVGAIYLDSNLKRLEDAAVFNRDRHHEMLDPGCEDGIHLQSVWLFVQRFLPEIAFEEDIQHILHLFQKQTPQKRVLRKPPLAMYAGLKTPIMTKPS